MKSFVTIWLLVISCAAMFVLCDSLSAHWGKTGSTNSLITFIALSPVAYTIFAFINKSMDLSIAGALVNTLIVVGAVCVGVIFFGEKLSAMQYVGIGLALVSVTILNMS